MDKHKMRLNTWAASSLENKVQKLMIQEIEKRVFIPQYYYRSGTVNSKSFVGKVLLRIKQKFELN